MGAVRRGTTSEEGGGRFSVAAGQERLDHMTPDESTARIDQELAQLRRSNAGLAARVQTVENALWITGSVVGAAALIFGLLVPFLVAEDDGDLATITLLGAVFGSQEDSSNGGPFSGEASVLSFLLGLLAVGTVVVVLVLLSVANRRISRRGLKASQILTVTYLVGAVGTWFVVFLVAGHVNADDGAIWWLSPATICFTVGAVIAAIMTTKGRDLMEVH
jgi:hypothetical protein